MGDGEAQGRKVRERVEEIAGEQRQARHRTGYHTASEMAGTITRCCYGRVLWHGSTATVFTVFTVVWDGRWNCMQLQE